MEIAEEIEIFYLVQDCCLKSLTKESSTSEATLDLILNRRWDTKLGLRCEGIWFVFCFENFSLRVIVT